MHNLDQVVLLSIFYLPLWKDFYEDKDVESSWSFIEEALHSGFGQTYGRTKGNRNKRKEHWWWSDYLEDAMKLS